MAFLVTYNVIISFQTGFNEALIVLVFFFTLSVSGINLSLTYGSLKPFGSIGIRFRPSFTVFLYFFFFLIQNQFCYYYSINEMK